MERELVSFLPPAPSRSSSPPSMASPTPSCSACSSSLSQMERELEMERELVSFLPPAPSRSSSPPSMASPTPSCSACSSSLSQMERELEMERELVSFLPPAPSRSSSPPSMASPTPSCSACSSSLEASRAPLPISQTRPPPRFIPSSPPTRPPRSRHPTRMMIEIPFCFARQCHGTSKTGGHTQHSDHTIDRARAGGEKSAHSHEAGQLCMHTGADHDRTSMAKWDPTYPRSKQRSTPPRRSLALHRKRLSRRVVSGLSARDSSASGADLELAAPKRRRSIGGSTDWRAGLLLPTTTTASSSSVRKGNGGHARAKRGARLDEAGVAHFLTALERTWNKTVGGASRMFVERHRSSHMQLISDMV